MALWLVNASTAAQVNTASWPSFRGNQGLTGTTSISIPKNIKLAWVSKMASRTKSSPVIGNNLIYIGSDDGTIYCLSMDGKAKWTVKTHHAIEAPPLFQGNSLYVGTLEGELFALDAATGNQRWKYQTEGQISGSPNFFMLGKNKKIIVGSYDYFLHCIDDLTGKADWKYETDNYINSSPSIAG